MDLNITTGTHHVDSSIASSLRQRCCDMVRYVIISVWPPTYLAYQWQL